VSVCVHACVYFRVSVRARACVHVCVCACVRVCMCACVHVCMCACVSDHICDYTSVCVRACVHMCVRVFVFVCMYARAHVCGGHLCVCASLSLGIYVSTIIFYESTYALAQDTYHTATCCNALQDVTTHCKDT